MATVEVLDWKRKKIGTVEVASELVEAPVRKEILHAVVRWQLALRRRGTHKAKTRAEVSGGGKKPFKQKGTGNARQGSSRSPLMPGGGISFGPAPRDYSYKLPKKFRQLALRTALSHLFAEGRLAIVSDMSSDGKTKELNQRLKEFGLSKAVLVDGQENTLFARASRNLPSFRYYSADGLNVYDLLKYNQVVLSKSSLEPVLRRCGLVGGA